MRFERKYRITHLNKSAIEQAVKLHPASFRKIYANRQVNNIYFDTPDFQTCKHNIEGANQRKKYRLRWYGTDSQQITNPRFEIKIKHNELGAKEIAPFEDTQLSNLAEITKQVNRQTNHLLHLSPTLLNTYQRSYFGTPDGKFRITIDWDLNYYSPLTKTTFSRNSFIEDAIILELKYEEKDDKLAREILQYLPFRQTKNSKYVTGILIRNTI